MLSLRLILRHWFFSTYSGLAVSLALGLVIGTAVVAPSPFSDWRVVGAGLGVLLGSVYFVQRQRLEELHLFQTLFKEFNARYDDMNERLNEILERTEGPLQSKERELLIDYFNLCSEEFLYYRLGYIYPKVWQAWKNGMNSFRADVRIRQLWDRELQSDSYYGLAFDR